MKRIVLQLEEDGSTTLVSESAEATEIQELSMQLAEERAKNAELAKRAQRLERALIDERSRLGISRPLSGQWIIFGEDAGKWLLKLVNRVEGLESLAIQDGRMPPKR